MHVPLLLAALAWERKAILRPFASVVRIERAAVPTWEVARPGAALRVIQTGMGLEAAARTARAIDDAAAHPWIVIGCAGGLDPTLRPGDVVVAESVSGDECRVACDAASRDRLAAAVRACGLVARIGPLVSSRAPLLSIEEKHGEWQRRGALAVEMEGAAIAAEAARRGVPFAMLRVVLDDAATGVRAAAGGPGTALGELSLARVGARLSRLAAALAEVV
jgi:nucleoside phosphorylase